MAKNRGRRTGPGTASRPEAVAVTSEERQHLIEDVAFFRAEHFRRVEPGKVRESDRAAAKDEIDSVLKGCGGQ